MVNDMPITIYTIAWALLGLFSLGGLYVFNRGRGIFVFLTSQKFLVLFLIAAVLGMRQMHWEALVVLAIAFIFIYKDYFPYVEKCRRLKSMQDKK